MKAISSFTLAVALVAVPYAFAQDTGGTNTGSTMKTKTKHKKHKDSTTMSSTGSTTTTGQD